MLWACGALALFLLSWSCAPTKSVVRERTLTLPQVLAKVQERNDKIHTLTGDGTITVETPEASNTGSFDMRLKKPDSLRVELNGPFGIRFGTLMLSRDRFLFYNYMENTALVGKPDGKTLNSLFRLRLQFNEVFDAFTGEFPTPAMEDSPAFTIRDNQYVITYPAPEGKKEYRIDGDAFVVTSYRVLDSAGKSILTAQAGDIDDDQDISMPRLLRIIFPKERRSVTINYSGVEFNQPVTCAFVIPRQAEIIHR